MFSFHEQSGFIRNYQMGALDVTRTSPNLKQKRIMTLIPDRTGPRISPRRPISIKLISRAE